MFYCATQATHAYGICLTVRPSHWWMHCVKADEQNELIFGIKANLDHRKMTISTRLRLQHVDRDIQRLRQLIDPLAKLGL